MKLLPCLRALSGILLLSVCLTTRAAQTLTISIVPQFPPEKLLREWTPVLKEVARLANVEFQFKVYGSIVDFETGFLKGEPDVAYMNPYHMVMARKAQNYHPIIRDDALTLTGILVVRKDSQIDQVAQLDGATLAFPAPNAFGASLYMRALLTESEKIHFTPKYVQTHSNVFRQVIGGQAMAGGAVRHTFEKEPAEIRALLRVLYETPSAAPHPIAVHPRVPMKIRVALQQAFLKLNDDPSFKPYLSSIQISRPTQASYRDYMPLEKLGLERYVLLKED